MTSPCDLSIRALAGALEAGTLTAVELAEAYLGRIAVHDAHWCAYLYLDPDDVRDQAARSDARRANRHVGLLEGIPIALKDNIHVAGWPTTNGSAHRALATDDAGLIERLRAAGAVLLGKVNMHEAALGATTDNPHHGRSHNPWRHGFTPGGSSGGSAVAVAARLAAAAVGSDTMGSIRLPASYCGIVGFKPSPGRISTRGTRALCLELDTFGPMTQTVEDAERVFQALRALDERDRATVRQDAPAAGRSDLTSVRWGVIDNFAQVDVQPAIAEAMDGVVERLQGEGAEIARLSLANYDPSTHRRAALLWVEADGMIANADLRDQGALSPELVRFLEYGASQPASRLSDVQRMLDDVRRTARRCFDTVDVLVGPTTAQTAFSFDEPAPANQADLTALANFAGCPSITLPLGQDADGLPFGIQLTGAPGQDASLLDVAKRFEDWLGVTLGEPMGERPLGA
ncbi:MAG: amidase [Pseudomonadota bacterium]